MEKLIEVLLILTFVLLFVIPPTIDYTEEERRFRERYRDDQEYRKSISEYEKGDNEE